MTTTHQDSGQRRPSTRDDATGDAVIAVAAAVQSPDFESFCRSRYPVIARSLVLALGSTDLGREAADEAFALTWERWTTVSQMANPSGWVFRVGLNWGRSFVRRIRREVSWADVRVGERTVDTPARDPGLARALERLSADHRTVLVAKYYLDWSEAEIASALDIPTGTVKSRLNRAIDKLNSTMGGHAR